ncbi:dihydroorotase [Engelhardtia mirabilis]|uniref:Dihydroorotase n=1 Tax=Engelhardtia mirabilis TaxID=2528011 RepID=A0A518BHC0_9BACT|nr:Dihydroorotase [Planctomycetes bacterium Pla133]QDV00708.1 Dihydroorotase [Planctomycetes bacterium Pla86]
MNDLFVFGGRVVGPAGPARADVLIRDGRISAVGTELEVPEGIERFDASGKLVLPGSIDPQVHFREPGLEKKEDLASGGHAALAGGVTSFMEMPNTKPATVNAAAIEDKLERAAGRVHCDHAFFVGATADNADELGTLEQLPGCAGIKLFMGSSTGGLLVRDDATIERVLRSGTRRVTFHSEDEDTLEANYRALGRDEPVTRHPEVRSVEAAVRSTTRLLDLAERTGRPVHVLHVSTADEVDLICERDLGELVTFELTPNHLFLAAPDCYEQHGSWAQMNPPVRDARHRDRLRAALADGLAACIGSDHAPHTAEEKARPYPQSPSGIPGVQTTLPLLLTAVRDGWLDWAGLLRGVNEGPRRVYGIEGKGLVEVGVDGDLAIVDPSITGPLQADWLRSRSPCNPFIGVELAGLPVATVVRGRLACVAGELVGEAQGQPLTFASVR